MDLSILSIWFNTTTIHCIILMVLISIILRVRPPIYSSRTSTLIIS